MVLTFETVNEILWCEHYNETSSAVLSQGIMYLVCSSKLFESVNKPCGVITCFEKASAAPITFQNFAYTRKNFIDYFLHKKTFTNRIVTVLELKGNALRL